MTESTEYKLMRMSESDDEDGFDPQDIEESEKLSETASFKRKYKEFYSDIKTDIKEDW